MSSRSAQNDSEESEAQGKLNGETLSLSAPAASHVRKYLLREGKIDSSIRVAAVRTHCMGGRGYSYSIDADSTKPTDFVIKSAGLELLVDQESMHYLQGAKIEYEESLQGAGLVVHNPNAVGKCHCGRHDLFDNQPRGESDGC